MLIIGVDPGLTGAISLINTSNGWLLECADLPTEANGTESGSMRRWVSTKRLLALLSTWSQVHGFAQESVIAAIERPIPMPSLPAQTIASQFDCFGVVRALLDVTCNEVRAVNPREWKKVFGLGSEKDQSRACALRLYPSAPVTRVKDHNRAESILLGHFVRMELH